MTEPLRFLVALSQTLSTMGLYGDDHPATQRAIETACDRLRELQAIHPAVEFTFLSGEVLFGSEVLPELDGWEWSERLARAGIERIEFTEAVEPGQLERLFVHLAARLGLRPTQSTELWQAGPSSIRFGLVTITDPEAEARRNGGPLAVASLSYSLRHERDTMGWLHDEVRNGSRLPLAEADGVVRSLSLAMHAEQAMVLPLLQLKDFDQYTTTHSMNVSVLAMALGEFLELGTDAIRSLGLAGLLHDLGKVCIPHAILNKPGRLTQQERAVVETHPAVGARMLLENPDPMDLAAVVAYEHHIMLDGGGYPRLPDARGAQYASRLVHVCDVYDALRTRRPYRDAWSAAQTVAYIESRAGIEFDPAIVRSFMDMMHQWDARALTPR